MSEYIDREAAISAILDSVEKHRNDQFGGMLLHYTGVIADLKCIPTADVRSAVHGKWVSDDISAIIKCNVCDADAPVDTTGPRQYKSRFCPNCGAQIDARDINVTTKPQTNADRIRSMTDEELADMVFYSPFKSRQDALNWMKQAADNSEEVKE